MATAPSDTMHIRTSSSTQIKGGGVDVVVKYNCGCGFQTSTLVDAVKHTAKLDHKMEIRGKVEVAR